MLSPLAVVEPWVGLGEGCRVHHFAWIGKLPSSSPALARHPSSPHRTLIGNGTEIGPHVVIYDGVTIGARCLIGDGVNIREGSTIGNGCMIGQGVSISFDAVIGDNVRLAYGAHITGGCRVGAGSFVGAFVVTANDRRREIVDYKFVGATPPIIGERCLIGSGAMLLPGVVIGDGAVIGMGALVVKDVPAGATVLGQPARERD